MNDLQYLMTSLKRKLPQDIDVSILLLVLNVIFFSTSNGGAAIMAEFLNMVSTLHKETKGSINRNRSLSLE